MKTWLFTWNPSRFAWNDKYDGYLEMKNQISQAGLSYNSWSCGNNKSIQKGDRIFLIRLGVEPRGIMASGYAATGVFEGPHWDYEKEAAGIKCRRIFIEFDRIQDPLTEDIILMDKLIEISPKYKWSSQTSGIEIPCHIAEELEIIWRTIQHTDYEPSRIKEIRDEWAVINMPEIQIVDTGLGEAYNPTLREWWLPTLPKTKIGPETRAEDIKSDEFAQKNTGESAG